jgi:hypothetical protein
LLAHDTQGTKPLVDANGPRKHDAAGKYPFRNAEGDGGLDGAGPSAELEELNSCEGVGGVYGNGDEDDNPDPHIGEEGKARLVLEIGEVLR